MARSIFSSPEFAREQASKARYSEPPPETAPDLKRLYDEAAVRHNVPANVLRALTERDVTTPRRSVPGAGRNPASLIDTEAATIRKALDAGQTPEQIVGSRFGSDAGTTEAVLARARAIAAEYPLPASAAPAPEPPAPQPPDAGLAGDAAMSVAAGATDMASMTARGIGAAGAFIEDTWDQSPEAQYARAMTGEPEPAPRPGAPNRMTEIADFLNAAANDIRSNRSKASQEAVADSQPTGDIFDPSSWSLGENPSIRGYLLNGSDLLGQLMGPIAAKTIAGSAGATAIGAAQGAGGGEQTARQVIDELYQSGALAAESPRYRSLIEKGVDPRAALDEVKRESGKWAAALTAPISALGGWATGKIVDPATHLLAGRGIVSRILGRAGIGAVEEGSEEVAETASARTGVNVAAGTDINPTEGTFGDFILGAMPGGVTGAMGGALSRREQSATDPGPAAPEAAPAPDLTPSDPVSADPVSVAQPAPTPAPFPSQSELRAQPAPPPSGPIGKALARLPVGSEVSILADGMSEPLIGTVEADDENGLTIRDADGDSLEIPREEIDYGSVRIALQKARETRAAAPAATREKPAEPQTIEEIDARLTYLAEQSKAAGWTKTLSRERNRLNKARAALETPANAETGSDGRTGAELAGGDGQRLSAEDVPVQPVAAGEPEGTPPADTPAADFPNGAAGEVAEPKPADALKDEFVTVETVYGDRLRVKRAELDGDSAFLRAYDAKGQPKTGDDRRVIRENLDLDGSRRAAQNADLTHIVRSDRKKGKDVPFASPKAVKDEIRRLGQPVEAFDVVPAGGGYIGRRKSADDAPQGRLPARLAGAKPRYGYRNRQFDLTFESDVDRAAYIAAQDKPSKRDSEYVAWAAEAAGMSEAQVRQHGKTIRQALNFFASDAPPDQTSIAVPRMARGAGRRDLAPAPQAAPEIDAAAHEAATSPQNDRPEPTKAQKEAGNYKLGHIKLGGLDISVENPAGSERKGVDRGGKAWSVKMKSHYGYIKGTVGKDKDHIDIFVKPGTTEADLRDASPVFIVNQIDPESGAFDEHKVLLGFTDRLQAWNAYHVNYAKGWKGGGRLDDLDTMTLAGFKDWLASGETSKPTRAIKRDKVEESVQRGRQMTSRANAKIEREEREAEARRGDKTEAGSYEASSDPRFAADRAALKSWKPGDRVEWTHKSFYRPSPDREHTARNFTGTVVKVEHKDLGTLLVKSDTGSENTIGASKLHKPGTLGPDGNPIIADVTSTELAAPVTLDLDGKTYELPSIEAAQVLWAKARDKAFADGIAPKDLPRATLIRNGKAFGYISQNGRAWEGDPRASDSKMLRDFDNGAMQSQPANSRPPLDVAPLQAKARPSESRRTWDMLEVEPGEPAAKVKQARNIVRSFINGLSDEDFDTLHGLFNSSSNSGFPSLAADAIDPAEMERQVREWKRAIEEERGTAAPAESPPVRFAENKLFTADRVEAARKRLKGKLSQINSGVDPEILLDGMTIAGAYVEAGIRDFATFAQRMTADLGAGIRPYLLSFWEGVRAFPGLDTKGMTPQTEAARLHAEILAGDAPEGAISEESATNQGEESPDEPAELDRSSEGALAGAPAGEIRRTEGSREAGRRAADGSGTDAPGDDGAGGRRAVRARGVGARARRVSVPEAREGDDGVGQSDLFRIGTQRPEPSASGPVAPPADFTALDTDKIGEGGQKAKYRDNLAAIRLLRTLEAEQREATRDEQAVLAKYVGWGGIAQAFEREGGEATKGWEREVAELKAELDTDEYAAAAASTRNAFYTSPEVIKGMWAAMERLGFNGGRVLEPSMGVGHFFGFMPKDLRKASALHGVELDRITGGIAKHLYPGAKIAAPMGFQSYATPDGYFDAIVGNPPFGSEKLYHPGRKDLSAFSIHNYFFARAIEAVKPGGVVAMVVTNRFLDGSKDAARQFIAAKADLIGAIRLPNDAFAKNAGTQVTTDIIFLRKRDGEKPHAAAANWLEVKEYTGKDGVAVPLNEYFVANPDMMLGDFGAYGTMYADRNKVESALVRREGEDTAALLASAVKRLPSDVALPAQRQAAVEPIQRVVDVRGAKVGSMFMDGDTVMIRKPDRLGETVGEPVTVASDAARDRLAGMIDIRDHLADLRGLQLDRRADAARIEAARRRLGEVYDAFVKKHGPLNKDTNKRVFRDDPTWPQIAALESDFDKGLTADMAKKTGEKPRPASAKKAAIFEKRTQFPPAPPTKAKSAKDALAASLAERGQVDPALMTRLYGKSVSDIVAELGDLVFENPDGGLETADQYLTGNVKAKLAVAREAAKARPDLARNVRALEAVQPADVEAVEISVKPGAHWLPSETVADFAKFILDAPAKAQYSAAQAKWVVTGRGATAAETQWGTRRVTAAGVLDAAINERPITVRDQIDSQTSVVNEQETQLANDKVKAVTEAFQNWVWEDDARRERLSRIYNDLFNTDVARRYDGAHLTFPGKIGDDIIELRPHQKDAVWRIVQSGTTLLDHVVGAGKTFTMVAAAMELRRMGLAKKPSLVVPNHLVGQWAADFLKLYPGANVLAASKKDFEKENRKKFVARIATGDWDAVIIAHSSFGKIEVDPASEAEFIREQIADIMSSEAELREGGEKSRNVKDLNERRTKLEEKYKKLVDAGRKDDAIYWDELGIDGIFVDEAHEFKNLAFSTTKTRVLGLGNPVGSQKAMDLFMKVRMVLKATGGRNVVFATGTPISNTMAEMFTMQRYLDYTEMQRRGLAHFDAWARTFGEVVNDWELTAAGKYKLTSRFAKFVNMPELMQRYTAFADVINRDDIQRQLAALGKRLPVPKLKGGRPDNVVVERSPRQAAYIGEPVKDADGADTDAFPKGSLVWRSENLPKGKPQPGDDNMLKIMSDARKAALDMRLIDPSAGDFAGSKVNKAAESIVEIYKRWDADKGTQLVFIDLSTPKGARAAEAARIKALIAAAEQGDETAQAALEKLSPDEIEALDGDFSVYDDLKQKLIDRGIPAAEIAFIHDANTEIQKEELFGKVRTGRVRVLFGSTAKMGAGMNVQDRLVALHHMDAPWRPSDLEQREGRIIRQGNRLYERDPNGFEVEVKRYATKQTLDSRMWQTIEAKARFIEQVRKGEAGVRAVEDVAGEAANAAEMKAASSGNPMILEEMSLRQAIRRLETERAGFRSEQHRIRDRIRYVEREQVQALKKIEELKEDAKLAVPDEFVMTIDGQALGSRKEAGQAILRTIDTLGMEDSAELGAYGGFKLVLERVGYGSDNYLIAIEGKHRHVTSEFDRSAQDQGVAQRIVNTIAAFETQRRRLEGDLPDMQRDVTRLKEQVAEWPKTVELEALKARHADVLETLKPKKPPAPPQAPQEPETPKYSIGRRAKGFASAAALSKHLESGTHGALVRKLIGAGAVVLHDKVADLPGGPHPKARIQGATMPDGTVHLVAEHLAADTAEAVLLHEAFHAGGKGVTGDAAWKRIMARLQDVIEAARGRELFGQDHPSADFWKPALERIDAARVPANHQAEELAAYAIEHRSTAPAGLREMVDNLLGRFKAWLLRRFGIQFGDVTPGELKALALIALRGWKIGRNVPAAAFASSKPSKQSVGKGDTFAAAVLSELAANDEMFALPRTKASSIEQAIKDMAPGVRFLGDTIAAVDQQETKAERRLSFRTPQDRDFHVYVDGDEIWLDISRSLPGQLGSRIYQALGDYAFNAKKTFIGDPAGLSKDALVRRTEAMLSSALRHGTTDHIAPHDYQLKGDASLGVPPLVWRYGDTLGNIQSLIDVSTAATFHAEPSLADARYDFDTGTFRTAEGAPLSDGNFRDVADAGAPRQHGASGPGRRSLKRGIFLRSLSSSPSGERPGILEQVLRLRGELLSPELSGIFYSIAHEPAPTKARLRDWLSERLSAATTQAMPKVLATVPLRPLLTEVASDLPSAKEYLRTKQAMDTMRDAWHARTDKVAQRWLTYRMHNREENVRLMDLMHEATIAQADPTADFESGMTERDYKTLTYGKKGQPAFDAAVNKLKADEERRAQHPRLVELYRKLSPEAQALFVDVRDTYKALADEQEAIILANLTRATQAGLKEARKAHAKEMQRIKDRKLTGQERADAIAAADQALADEKNLNAWRRRARITRLRQQFEQNRIKGPYFPLARFGLFFVSVRDSGGQMVSFSRFEKAIDQTRFIKEMKAANPDYQIEKGVLEDATGLNRAVDPEFVADIEDMLSEAGAERELRDQVWQRYLMSLPDLSIRKNRIHRSGRAGYIADALRAFGNHMFHGAHQTARLKHAMELRELIDEAREEAVQGDDPVRNGLIVNEIEKRNAFIMNPTGSSFAQAITSFGFIYHLSVTPAAALVNLSQTVIMGVPVLAAYDGRVAGGVAAASRELTRAMRDFTAGRGKAERSKRLTDDERSAMHAAYETGLIERTQSHDLAGVGETGVEYSATRQRVMGWISAFFHHAERLNREVTFLAAYRMARAKGRDHSVAITDAADLTWKAHFDYQNTSRPRVMQSDTAKVLLMFRNYTVNMLYRLVRDLRTAVVSPAERREALMQLGGITAMMLVNAGIRGTWLVGSVMALASVLFGGEGEDPQEMMRKGMMEFLPAWVVGPLMDGVWGYALNIDLSERIGMADLWFRGSDRQLEGHDLAAHWLSELAGPAWAPVENAIVGMSMLFDGDVFRGVETMAPKFIKDQMRAVRFASEGAQTLKGDDILSDMSPDQIIVQALGFTPAQLAERYRQNTAMKNMEDTIVKRRSKLLARYDRALRENDSEAMEDILADMDAFNADYPEYPLTPKSIRQSMRSREQSRERNEGGIQLNPKLNERIRQEAAPALYD